MSNSRAISKDDLVRHFHLPLSDAAKQLGTCTTLLKKICRQNGIPRWPYRRLCSLDKKIGLLEASIVSDTVDKSPSSSPSSDDKNPLASDLCSLRWRRASLVLNPELITKQVGGVPSEMLDSWSAPAPLPPLAPSPSVSRLSPVFAGAVSAVSAALQAAAAAAATSSSSQQGSMYSPESTVRSGPSSPVGTVVVALTPEERRSILVSRLREHFIVTNGAGSAATTTTTTTSPSPKPLPPTPDSATTPNASLRVCAISNLISAHEVSPRIPNLVL